MLHVSVREAGPVATLSGAILLYGTSGRQEEDSYQFATVHSVRPINGRPEVQPGRLLTERDLVGITTSITETAETRATHWIDPGVLAKGHDRIVWWTPPGVRPMVFEKSSYNSKTFSAAASSPVPGLIWLAMPGKGLYLYAVKGEERPTQATDLYQAPFFNVWGSGKVCIGTANLPTEEMKWLTSAWEKTFFGSRFTHPNFTQKDRLIKGVEPCGFWKRMLAKPAKSFPEDKLVQVPLRVEHLLESTLLDRLGAQPRPTGEF